MKITVNSQGVVESNPESSNTLHIDADAFFNRKVTFEDNLTGIVAVEDHILYLDAVSGSDSNNGLTAATAIQTIGKARELQPHTWKKKCRLYFASGTYTWPTTPQNRDGGVVSWFVGAPDNSAGDNQIWIGGYDQVAGPFTAVSASDGRTFTVSGGGLTPGALRGAIMTWASGTNTSFGSFGGSKVTIIDNDDSVIKIADWNNDPGPLDNVSIGDVVNVYRPNVTITAPHSMFIDGLSNANSHLTLQGLRIQVPSFRVCSIRSVNMILDRCEFDIGATGFVYFYQYAGVNINGGAANPDLSDEANSAGCYFKCSSPNGGYVQTIYYSWFNANPIIADNMHFLAQNSGKMNFRNFHGKNTVMTVNSSEATIAGKYSTLSGVLSSSSNTGGSAFAAVEAAFGSRVYLDKLGIFDNERSAVAVRENSLVVTDTVSGSNNTPYGFLVYDNGAVLFNSSSTTVSGSSAQVWLQGTTSSFADIVAASGSSTSDNRLNVVMARTVYNPNVLGG